MSAKRVRWLRGQIRLIEESIKLKEKLSKDASYEKELVEAWCEYLPGGSKHHLLSQGT